MDSMPAANDMNVMGDPEGGCIVQADDPQMLAATAFDGVAPGSSGSNSWYWTSMLKLMEQGPAPTTSCMSNNNLQIPAAPFTPGQQHSAEPPSASSPSSSSVHDQPIELITTQNNAINTSDPDNSVWAQEFLSGPIGETKTSSSIACSEDGLHELLYPRTVLEILFSDQLKLEQMPSWPDMLQAHSATNGSAKAFAFPLTSDKILAGSIALDTVSMEENQHFDTKCTQYLNNYSHLSACIDDHLSSSTASSTLSDNAIDQWGGPQTAAGSSMAQAGENSTPAHLSAMAAHSSPLSTKMQLIDPRCVKQEYDHVHSPSFTSNDQSSNYIASQYAIHQGQPLNPRSMMATMNASGNGFKEPMMSMGHDQFEAKPANNLLSKLWNSSFMNANDPLAHINHKHHIYESITAANFSHNLRQIAGLTANGYNMSNMINGVQGNGGPPTMQNYVNHQQTSPLPVAKKSRPFHDMRDPAAEDSKPSIEILAAAAGGAAAEEAGGNLQLAMHMQQQHLSEADQYNNFKRSRIEPPATSASTSTTNSTSSSSSSFKSQPVRKEKLSERIATLQQLVSPFGKTDTASVLLEAIGYIKFLQEQVQALSLPYFKSPSSQSGERSHNGEEIKPDLKSRGLCLVPLSCTMQVANDNGADYWYGASFR